MFIWFNQNKFNYNKGQLTPIFIVVLVVLIIMALITVNLGKVAFIKTDSSNAVDAGALAGGSLMANTFDAVARANADMYNYYWSFYYYTAIPMFTIALTMLYMAYDQACPNPCTAIGTITRFIRQTIVIGIIVSAYNFAQNRYYNRIINETAVPYRNEAIKIAHKFTFMNSGIGTKLKEGEPPAEISDADQRRNYREEFTNFLDHTVGYNLSYTYAWEDGQERDHRVISTISVDEVDTFRMRVTHLSYAAEIGLLVAARQMAIAAKASLTTACRCQIRYFRCVACCSSSHPGCCACIAPNHLCWMTSCAAAMSTMTWILPIMAAALLGLLPGGTAENPPLLGVTTGMPCWIDDIVYDGDPHNRRFRVDTFQHHVGADLGLWESSYPDTRSYSIVNFRGRGQIYEPRWLHDASIVETDR